MDRKDKIDKLEEIESEADLRVLLRDLLSKMGFYEVRETHQVGRTEEGKDIIAAWDHAVDGREWYSFVVKQGRIGGGTQKVETVKHQVSQSFEYRYPSPEGEITVNKVRVVSNGNITKGAKRLIGDHLEARRGSNVAYWDRAKLIDRIDQYYQGYWSPHLPAIEEYGAAVSREIDQHTRLKQLRTEQIREELRKRVVDVFIEPRITERKIKRKKGGDKEIQIDDLTLNQLLESDDSYLLTGEPGSGKTRVLDRIYGHYGSPEVIDAEEVLPILLSVDELREHGMSVGDAVDAKINEMIPEFAERLNGDRFNLLLLIDSVDFLGEKEMDGLVDSVAQVLETRGGRVLIASRSTEGFEFGGDEVELREVRLERFDQSQIEEYVSRCFTERSKGERFLSVLRESNLLEKLPTTPLTLSLMSLIYDQEGHEVPATLTDIYREFTDILLGKLNLKEFEDLIHLNLHRRLLASLSFEMLSRQEDDIAFDEVYAHLEEFLDGKDISEPTPHELRHFLKSTGLTYIDERDLVGFKHTSFMEYFAALELFKWRREDDGLLIEHFSDPHWQNTAVFYAGMSRDMPKFVDRLLDNVPNESARQKARNITGFGYLAQALYMTDLSQKVALVESALENLPALYKSFEEATANEDSMYHDLSHAVIGSVVSYLFRMNFRSVTLDDALSKAFDHYASTGDTENARNFFLGFKLFTVASTLSHKYIDNWHKFDKLTKLKCFIDNPLLDAIGTTYLEHGEVIDSESERFSSIINGNLKRYNKLLEPLTSDAAHEVDEKLFLKGGEAERGESDQRTLFNADNSQGN